MCVHATVMRQSKAGRLVVHLYCDLNTTAHRALPADDVPLREEAVPIPDIRVTFGRAYKVQRVTLEPGGTELSVTRTAAVSAVVVPRLEVHAMVVAEIE